MFSCIPGFKTDYSVILKPQEITGSLEFSLTLPLPYGYKTYVTV